MLHVWAQVGSHSNHRGTFRHCPVYKWSRGSEEWQELPEACIWDSSPGLLDPGAGPQETRACGGPISGVDAAGLPWCPQDGKWREPGAPRGCSLRFKGCAACLPARPLPLQMAASGCLGTGLWDSRLSWWHGDKCHDNLPPLWGLGGREDLRRHKAHTEASEQNLERWLPLSLGGFCPPTRDTACQVLSQ
ncbi:hypothetical protein H1C71_017970 [Ictidomys tridecemlineatus]|nr:hypothetical protein H1C71_017970 [Ictidomys tridecemlineatus]KAG3262994.1 hypothetical protein H1C71_017970 [Ictidomys tridecemlineatus]